MRAAVDIETLYEDLDELGVDVFSCPLSKFEAMAEPEGYLGVDYSKIQSEAQEREILIHEEGHFATNTFYTYDSPFTIRQHQENIAIRHGYKKYYSLEKLLAAMEEGYTEVWDLAEHFGVSQEYVREMLAYYTGACGVDFAKELAIRHRDRALAEDPIAPETLEQLKGIGVSCHGPLTETAAQDILRLEAFVRQKKAKK